MRIGTPVKADRLYGFDRWTAEDSWFPSIGSEVFLVEHSGDKRHGVYVGVRDGGMQFNMDCGGYTWVASLKSRDDYLKDGVDPMFVDFLIDHMLKIYVKR